VGRRLYGPNKGPVESQRPPRPGSDEFGEISAGTNRLSRARGPPRRTEKGEREPGLTKPKKKRRKGRESYKQGSEGGRKNDQHDRKAQTS